MAKIEAKDLIKVVNFSTSKTYICFTTPPLMKKITLLLILMILPKIQAQKTPHAVQVIYEKTSNGKVIENQDLIVLFADKQQTIVTTEKITSKKAPFPYEFFYLNRAKNNWFQTAQLKEDKSISTVDSTSITNQKFTFNNDTKKILGFLCKKATISINSNTIAIWYTTALGIKGAPSVLGQDLGLVLEVTRNNNYSITATKVVRIKAIPIEISTIPSAKTGRDLLSYRDELWKSRFTTISVFDNEIINFSDASKSNDSIFRFANGTVIVKRISINKIKTGSQVFIDLKEQSKGDAYDRTGSVFVIPMDSEISFFEALQKGKIILPLYENGNGKQYQGVVRTEKFTPILELMRFFTPFGVHHFNYLKTKNKEWEEAAFYRQDISDLVSVLSGQEVLIGVFIGNYDKGGHQINMNLTVHNEENSGTKAKKIIPLFNTLNIMEMAGQEYGTMFNSEKGLEIKFTLKEEVVDAKLRYITTGHGGWENGDEYLQKKNSIFLDSKEVFSFIPWKTDCASYRTYNPASGNFENGLSSSDYSRSNWCPGTTTNPLFIELGNVKAGEHTITIKIPQGANEGTSFSSWNVSGVLIGN